MAKTKQRAEGIRAVTFLIDNATEWEPDEEMEVLADVLLDNDEPERTSTDKGHKLGYASFADPNNPHAVNVRVGGVVKNVPINGQMFIGISDKAITKATPA